MLHEQEIQYTIPKLTELLARHHLRFLKFADRGGVYDSLKSVLGSDVDVYDLATWDEAERALPSM